MASLKVFSIISLLFLNTLSVENGYKVGDLARDFKLKNVDGKFISMSGNKENKGYIVIFTCNTCPWANLYDNRVIALHDKYAPKGYPVIAIQPNDPVKSPGDSFEEMKKNHQAKGYTFPYVIDETQEITKAYGATNTPHVYVLKKEKKDFRVQYIGAIDNNPRDGSHADKRYVEEAVDALLAGNQVPVKSTKAIGCSIKWKAI